MPAVYDDEGNLVATQVLSDGQLAFLAQNIPALGSRAYSIATGKRMLHLPDEGAPVPLLSNADFEVQVDETTGAIKKLLWKEMNLDLADHSNWSGLNQYLYVRGRSPENPLPIEEVRIMPGEEGPLVNSIRIISRPPGARIMETEIELVSGLDAIFIRNTLDKEKVYDPEAVHIAFPFNIPDGTMRYDMAFGHCEVEKDQVKGSNRNFITMENWLDISNEQYGVTVACPDVPLFQAGRITMDEIVTGWVDSITQTQTFFSYVMNNYWETNYAAAQEGTAGFSYVIRPHKGFDPLEAERFGMENRYPLVVIPGTQNMGHGTRNPKHGTRNPEPGIFSDLIMISLKPTGVPGEKLACLYNASDNEVNLDLDQKKTEFFRTDVDGLTRSESIEALVFPPKAIRFLLVVNK
jgi:alpha-mannosidase